VQNYTVLLTAVFRFWGPALKAGFQVWDAFLKMHRTIRVEVVGEIEDSRGLAHPMNIQQAPSLQCGCPFCKIVGITWCGTAVYPGAITNTRGPGRENLRANYAEEFKEVPQVAARAQSRKPAPRTTAEHIASGKRMDAYKGNKTNRAILQKSEPSKGEDAFSTALRREDGTNWDIIRRIANDPAHAFSNLCKNLLGLICSRGMMKWKPARIAKDRKAGRFKNIRCDKKVNAMRSDAPWLASNERLREIDDWCESLKMPTDWDPIGRPFEESQKMSIAMALSFLGDRGCYILGLLVDDLNPEILDMFMRLIRTAGLISFFINLFVFF
jgi:hypothetical protein